MSDRTRRRMVAILCDVLELVEDRATVAAARRRSEDRLGRVRPFTDRAIERAGYAAALALLMEAVEWCAPAERAVRAEDLS